MAEQIVVGVGATHGVGSDRYPYTVVEVVNERRIVVQRDEFRRTDSNGLSESQEYEYTPNPNAEKLTLTLRRNGRWAQQGQPVKYDHWHIGDRNAYKDPHF